MIPIRTPAGRALAALVVAAAPIAAAAIPFVGSGPTAPGRVAAQDVAEPEPPRAPAWPGVPVGPVIDLEQELARDVVADSVGSIAAAVIAGDRVVWRAAFGWSDRDRRTLATPSTIYRVGSITKVVTALTLLTLVRDDVVGLDDRVVDHVPELRSLRSGSPARSGSRSRTPDVRGITFRRLASHTAGLGREPLRLGFNRGPFLRWKERLVQAIPETPAVRRPGEAFEYSNIGYSILGLALERAAGRPFELLVHDRVLVPLGMADSYLHLRPSSRSRLATGYVVPAVDTLPPDPRVPAAEHRGRGVRVPSGGMYSTVDDLARLAMALVGAAPRAPSGVDPLPEALRREMLADHAPTGDRGYGLGLQITPVAGTVLVGHTGRMPGYESVLLVDPEAGTGVVILRNYNRGSTNLAAVATRLLLALR